MGNCNNYSSYTENTLCNYLLYDGNKIIDVLTDHEKAMSCLIKLSETKLSQYYEYVNLLEKEFHSYKLINNNEFEKVANTIKHFNPCNSVRIICLNVNNTDDNNKMKINTDVLIYCPQTRTIKKISADKEPINTFSNLKRVADEERRIKDDLFAKKIQKNNQPDKKLGDLLNILDTDAYSVSTASTCSRETRRKKIEYRDKKVVTDNKRNDYIDRRKNNNTILNEEAELDALINSNKKKLDNAQVMSDTCDDSDNDSIDSLIHTSDDDVYDNNKQKVILKNEVTNVVQRKTDAEIFTERCEAQKKRLDENRKKEKLCIFESDKNVYLTMRGRIKNGTLKEKNVSPLFTHKYHIFKFMEDNNVVAFNKNTDIQKEHKIYEQLYKVIESLEKDDENDMNMIDDEYLELCDAFMEYVYSSEIEIFTEARTHEILNENPNLKEKMFKEAVNQTIFTKDISKEEYE
jgi:hypothetical protein